MDKGTYISKNIYSTIGASLELLAASPYHQDLSICMYFHTQILPPIHLNQNYIYYSEDETPVALVTTAWIEENILEELTSSANRIIQSNEWKTGDVLFFNDFIAPYGNAAHVFSDLVNDIYSGVSNAYSIRKRKGGEIRKVNKWSRRQKPI